MAQLFQTPSPTAAESDCSTVPVGTHGTAIWADGSASSLQTPADSDAALASAAAIVTKQGCDLDGTTASRSDGGPDFLLAAAGSSVLHNGTALEPTGIAVLSRKDEILVAAEGSVRRFYYSDEVIPEPETIPEDLSKDSCCPRCRKSLHEPSPTAASGDADADPTISRKPLIRCGGCGTLYHAHGCFAYEPTCLMCMAPTTGHKLWTPEQLD